MSRPPARCAKANSASAGSQQPLNQERAPCPHLTTVCLSVGRSSTSCTTTSGACLCKTKDSLVYFTRSELGTETRSFRANDAGWSWRLCRLNIAGRRGRWRDWGVKCVKYICIAPRLRGKNEGRVAQPVVSRHELWQCVVSFPRLLFFPRCRCTASRASVHTRCARTGD